MFCCLLKLACDGDFGAHRCVCHVLTVCVACYRLRRWRTQVLESASEPGLDDGLSERITSKCNFWNVFRSLVFFHAWALNPSLFKFLKKRCHWLELYHWLEMNHCFKMYHWVDLPFFLTCSKCVQWVSAMLGIPGLSGHTPTEWLTHLCHFLKFP